MTWFDDEQSVHDGGPVELYQITTPTQTFRLTSHTQDISFMSQTWKRSSIQRGKIDQASDASVSSLQLSIDTNENISDELLSEIPEHDIQLTLYRYHPETANSIVIWDGPITSVSAKGENVQVEIPSVMLDAINTNLPRLVIQRHCNHVLYDRFCKLKETDFYELIQVTAISSDGLTITTDGTTPLADVYQGGALVNPDGERRLVVANTTGNIHTLITPFRRLLINDFITRMFGCDHTIDTCDSKFNNAVNFGGHPYVPAKNLFRIFGGIRSGGIE